MGMGTTMRKRNRKTIWRSSFVVGVLLLLVATSFHCLGASRTRRKVGSGQIIPARGPYPPSAPANGEHLSPDEQYIASAIQEAPNTVTLTIIDARSRKTILKEEVDSFVWVPNHPHRLVVAKCGPFSERALLGMWEGESTWRSLYRVRHPKQECFTLFGVSRNGRYVIYGHQRYQPDFDLETDEMPKRRRWLRLPPPRKAPRQHRHR